MKDLKGTAMVPHISFPYLNSAKSRCIITTDNYYHNLNQVVDLIEATILNVLPASNFYYMAIDLVNAFF